MSSQEGVLKFEVHWEWTPPHPAEHLTTLLDCRQRLYHVGLIGADADGIGYGNISQRLPNTDRFYISGSATGGLPNPDLAHWSRVDRVDLSTNQLWCQGPCVASSESMSHAAVYHTLPATGGVVHVHHLALWQHCLYRWPTTPESASYGTPAMAGSIAQLLRSADAAPTGLVVMAGHREGLLAYAPHLSTATELVLALWREYTL